MNLTEAHKIATAATAALDVAIGEAQLLLARKRHEREARLLRFDDIVTVMEAEKDAADDEIAALEVFIFGEKKAAAAEPEAPADTNADEEETEIFRRGMGGTQPRTNGHDQEAAE